MKVVGIYNNNGKGTLHVIEEFATYFNSPENGRTCEGNSAKSVYVGDLDISNIKVGSEIDILYGEAIPTKNGVYSPIRRIDVLK